MQYFDKINIKDKQLFDKYLKEYNPQVSELTFTNLFMWRDYYKISFKEIEGFLCILSNIVKDEPFAFVPIKGPDSGHLEDATEFLKAYFASMNCELKFKRVAESELSLFRPGLQTELDPVNNDYVYLASDLIKLAGKRYDGKRNHINKFKKKYEYEFENINEYNIKECYKIMDAWCAERECDEHKGVYCEKLANTELLNNYKVLECEGIMVKVEGEYKAFSVGEMLSADTAVIHIEKADSKIDGLYTFTNQKFCENSWKDAMFINREQDLGVEGLRKAKLSYHPVKIMNKYVITF